MSDSDPTGEKPHPHHWGRRLLIGGAALVVVLGLLTALAPTLISTGPGTRAVVAIANRSLRGTLAIDDLDAGWFSPTRLKGVTLTGEDGQIIVSVRELALQDKSVAGLIRSVEDLGRVTGDTIGVNLVRYDDGSTNLQRALPQPQPDDDRNKPDEPAEPLAYHTDIQLSNIVFSLASPGTDPVTVNAPKVNLKLAGQSRLDLDVDATLTQRQHVGRITAVGELREWTTPARSADLTAQLQAVPVAVLDHLLGYDRRLVALLGQQIDGELVVQGTQESALLHLTARSPRASVELPLRLSTAALTSDNGGHLLLTVTPEAYAAWTVAPTSGELLAPVTLAISLGELRLPMEDSTR